MFVSYVIYGDTLRIPRQSWLLATLCDVGEIGHPPISCIEEATSPTQLKSWCSQTHRLR